MNYKKIILDYLCVHKERTGMIAPQEILEENGIFLEIDQIRTIVNEINIDGLITVQEGKNGPRICLNGLGKNKCEEN